VHFASLQKGKTALDRAKDGNEDEIVKILTEWAEKSAVSRE
jgi:hypothetical protein